MNWTDPPRNGKPQTGQSLKQKLTPNASSVSHTLGAESTLRCYARLGYWHFVGLLPLFYFIAHAMAGPLSICSDTIPNTDGFVGSAPTGMCYDQWRQA
jgi:hypothetical protein